MRIRVPPNVSSTLRAEMEPPKASHDDHRPGARLLSADRGGEAG